MKFTFTKRKIIFFLTGLAFQALTLPLFAASDSLIQLGNQLVSASNGCTFRLRGVNVDGLEYDPTGSQGPGILVSVAQAVTGWGANFIRLPLSQDYWFGCGNSKNGNASFPPANYQNIVTNVVNYCSSQNVYVLLDLHWSGTQTGATAPCGTGWDVATAQHYMPDDNSVTFWTSVASTYANNPAVFFDLYNEPYDYDGNGWTIWRDGGVGTSYGYHTPGMQVLINTVRATGANNIVVVGGLDYAYTLASVASFPMTNTGNGLMYSSHIYPFKGSNPWGPNDGNGQILPGSVSNPVLIGEFGQGSTIPPGSTADPNGTWDQALLAWINGANTTGYQFHATAWDMHNGSCPCLISNWSYTPTTWHGVPVKNWLATPIPTCFYTPTPTFSPTPCGYPGNTCTPTNTFTPTSTFTPTPTPNPNNDILWPNPWKTSQPLSFYHTLSTPADSVHLKLYTLSFRKIYEDDNLDPGKGEPKNWQVTYTLSWDQLGNVANGLYYVVLEEWRGGNMTRSIMKLIIER